MKLKELYKHRTDFTIIGLTGRAGSGCTKIANFLSSDISKLNSGLREKTEFTDHIFKRKFEICQNYLNYGNNWQKFDVINYNKVLLFYILIETKCEFNKIKEILLKYYKDEKVEDNIEIVNEVFKKVEVILNCNTETIKKIKALKALTEIRDVPDLIELNDLFFGVEYKMLSNKILLTLENGSYYKSTKLFHLISCNIRSSKTSLSEVKTSSSNVYVIAEYINTLIKARKKSNQQKEQVTKIVIDCLRNSLEIMFFKERYSAFYLIATKDILNNSIDRIHYRLRNRVKDEKERKKLVEKLIQLDDDEYKTNDFSKGTFSSPDIENCIQKSDFHIFNLKKIQIEKFLKSFDAVEGITKEEQERFKNIFLTREEQLMKLIALINEPGLVTPSASERNMQIAYTAKINSGCISRQVGAVITDKRYYLKAIGWNDVAKGHTPCNLRNVEDFLENNLDNNVHYSEFEKGEKSNKSSYKYKNSFPHNFKDAMVDYFEDKHKANKEELNGKNCSFCFKTIHNYYEGESNQVHTRSLHAEENAMLQLTKFGGMGVENGILFTTASPCELCSKKAYQLGIRFIYYVDPYPGIAVDQIINGGVNKPILIPFSGAIGSSYHKLYEPYISAKDEITMTLEIDNKNININQFKNIVKKILPNYNNIEDIKTMDDVKSIINYGFGSFNIKE